MEDFKVLTETVCCIARETGYFLKQERKGFRPGGSGGETCT